MRFPAGLTARLLRHRISQAFRSERTSAIIPLPLLVKPFSTASLSETFGPDTEWHTSGAFVRIADQANASVIWLGGVEPLFHPAIGDAVAALAERGLYVFLHTNGAGLRKRIHELKPVPRLYLTVEIPLDRAVDSVPGDAPGGNVPFQTVAEALRTARLSGFFLCGHFTVSNGTTTEQVFSRLRSLGPLALDGVAVSSGSALAPQSTDPVGAAVLAQVTQLIPSHGWRSFSRLLQASRESMVSELPGRQPRSAGACEETA